MLNTLTQDQYRFLLANVAGLSLAIPYKFIPKTLRNEYNYLPGLFLVYYCFGKDANSLVIFSAISYSICKFTPRQYVQRATMCSSLAFLSYIHLSRQLLDYGGYVLDISGPFMIAVQKMTSLGFCLYDGKRVEDIEKEKLNLNSDANQPLMDATSDANNNVDDDNELKAKSADSIASVEPSMGRVDKANLKRDINQLTEEQKKYAVLKEPSFNDFMGYFFHFPSVLCGPIMYFNDYMDFINRPERADPPPGRFKAAFSKITISAACACLHLYLLPQFYRENFATFKILQEPLLIKRFYYVLIFTMLSRLKYYVAWHLGEAISNASGFGFDGHDENGNPSWNLISNMDIFKFETCLNLRDAILAWNKTTQNWLRRTAYERAPRKFSLLSTYLLSAVWHGFYPGYYMTFLGGALFTLAARNGRRVVRPMFQRGTLLPKIYDVTTFILTRLTIAYTAFPFVILDFNYSLSIYKSLYFSIHILALGGILLGFIFRRK